MTFMLRDVQNTMEQWFSVILGFSWAGGATAESERRNELLIFITPRIVNRAESIRGGSTGSVQSVGEVGAGAGQGSSGGGRQAPAGANPFAAPPITIDPN